MGADELEDYLEVSDAAVNERISQSNADIAAGRVLPAGGVVAELRARKARGAHS